MFPRANLTLKRYGRIHCFLGKNGYSRPGTSERFSFLSARCHHLPTLCLFLQELHCIGIHAILVQSKKKSETASPREQAQPKRKYKPDMLLLGQLSQSIVRKDPQPLGMLQSFGSADSESDFPWSEYFRI